MPDGRLADAINVIGGRRRKSALHDDALAAAGVIVAGRAIDVVALAAAFQIRARDGEGKLVREDAIFFSGVEEFVEAELAARDGAGDDGAFAAAVVEERGGLVGQIFRLLVHVHAAACEQQSERAQTNHARGACHRTVCRGAVGVAGLEIRLQSRILRVDSGLPETFWSSPGQNFCRALSLPGKSGRWTRGRSAPR